MASVTSSVYIRIYTCCRISTVSLLMYYPRCIDTYTRAHGQGTRGWCARVVPIAHSAGCADRTGETLVVVCHAFTAFGTGGLVRPTSKSIPDDCFSNPCTVGCSTRDAFVNRDDHVVCRAVKRLLFPAPKFNRPTFFRRFSDFSRQTSIDVQRILLSQFIIKTYLKFERG